MTIKPGTSPNSINLGSNGVVPVAIFGSASFDVHQINPASTTLANASIKPKGNSQPNPRHIQILEMNISQEFKRSVREITNY